MRLFVLQVKLRVVGEVEAANYAVRLKLGTNSSGTTTVEFILHVMDSADYRMIRKTPIPVTTDPVVMPTGFRSNIEWSLFPSSTFEVGFASVE